MSEAADFMSFLGGGSANSTGAATGSAAASECSAFLGSVSSSTRANSTATSKQSKQSECDAFLSGGTAPSHPATTERSNTTYLSDGAERRKMAREAYKRIRDFMVNHDVHFNGAGEKLPRVEQAWSIQHLDERTARDNVDTIKGIASILKEYKQIRCTVHGETGAAKAVPKQLADYLRADPTRDVRKCMDALAKFRAQACLDALCSYGVPRDQLLLSSQGMGGHVRVDFIPEGYVEGEVEPEPAYKPVQEFVYKTDPAESQRCKALEEDKRRLLLEIQDLKRQLAAKRPEVVDDSRWRAAEAEVARLRRENERLLSELEAERAKARSIEERVRAEVERRLHEERRNERERAMAAEDELHRIRPEFERLIEENFRLKDDLEDCRSQPAPQMPQPTPMIMPQMVHPCCGGCAGQGNCSSLADLLPSNMELSSLKRSEWRRLFERLVAELARRKGQSGHGMMGMPGLTPVHSSVSYEALPSPGYNLVNGAGGQFQERTQRARYRRSDYDVRAEVDRLWSSAARRPYSGGSYQRSADADDFLRFADRGSVNRESTKSADDFLRFAGDKPRPNNADDFIKFASSTKKPDPRSADDFLNFSAGQNKVPNPNSADDFLKFSGPAQAVRRDQKPRSSDADAFLAFSGR